MKQVPTSVPNSTEPVFLKKPEIKRLPLYGDPQCRFVAFLIDTIFLVFIHSLIAYFWVELPEQMAPNQGDFLNFQVTYILTHLDEFTHAAIVVACFLIVQSLYYAVMESSGWQGTIGKVAVGLRVADLKGHPVGFWRALGRHAGKFGSLFLLGLGYLLPFYHRRRQALHDLLSGCLVLRR